MLTGLPEVAPEEDDDELQAAAVRASSATPATVSCRRGVRPWMRIVISASDHTNNNRKGKATLPIPIPARWHGSQSGGGSGGLRPRGGGQGAGRLQGPG